MSSRALAQDDYVCHLWKIYKADQELGVVQPLKLALNRSDYMLHSGLPGAPLKQVELNLMASSFGGITERLQSVHQMRVKQLLGDAAPEVWVALYNRFLFLNMVNYTTLLTLAPPLSLGDWIRPSHRTNGGGVREQQPTPATHRAARSPRGDLGGRGQCV